MPASAHQPEDFADHLRHLLDDRDMTQADLADRIGVRPQMIGKYLRGSIPGQKRAKAIDDALKADGAILAALGYDRQRRPTVEERLCAIEEHLGLGQFAATNEQFTVAADKGRSRGKGRKVSGPAGHAPEGQGDSG